MPEIAEHLVEAGVTELLYTIADDRIEIRPEEGTVTADGVLLPGNGTTKFKILAILASRADAVVPISDLSMGIYGYYDKSADDTVKAHVWSLRRALGPELGHLSEGAIRTKRGVGYSGISSLTDEVVLASTEEDHVYSLADERVAVDSVASAVFADGKPVPDMTHAEFKVLSLIAQRADRLVGVQTLINLIGDGEDTSTHDATLSRISRIRKKLGPELGDIKEGAIRTYRGIGYYGVRSLSTG